MANDSPSRLPKFEKGKKLLATDLQQIVNALITRITGGQGISITALAQQIVISREDFFVPQPASVEMSVRSVQKDYLTCRLLGANGELGTDNIFVLLPHTLRRTPFEGFTVDGVAYTYNSNIERVADGTDTFKLTPNYYVGAQILVIRQNNVVTIDTGDQIDLVDNNENSRTWALDNT